MNRHFSIYLDAIRFLMAILVFIYHSAFPPFLPWLPWLNVGHHAVIVFFVLSGMVIAWVTESKENTCTSYLVARVVRIYSALIPTLAISVPALYIGSLLAPGAYAGYLVPPTLSDFLASVVGNLLLLNQHGWFPVSNFANVPIWSLCYEFWYYLMFAAFVFPRRRAVRFAAFGLLAAFVGPRVLLLFPIWVLGVFLRRRVLLRPLAERAAWVLFVLPVVLYLVGYFLWWPQLMHEWTVTLFGPGISKLGFSQHFMFDYIFGIGVAAHFVGANRVIFRFGVLLERLERPIRLFAAYTLSLYLMHYPLLQFFAALMGHDPQSIASGLLLWGLTLATIVLVSSVTEQRRYVLKNALERVISVGRRGAAGG